MSAQSRVLKLYENIWKIPSKGLRNEKRVVAAFSEPFPDIPDWLLNVENGSKCDERAGIDVNVFCDIGVKLPIQVKSCQKKAQKFREDQENGRYSKEIEVIVIEEDFTPERVRQVVIAASYIIYKRRLAGYAARPGVTFIPAPAAA